MKTRIIVLLLFFSIVFNTTLVFSEEENLSGQPENPDAAVLEELRWLQAEGEAVVSITTKSDVPISKAPGIVTVIMARQIKQMGFKTLADVLETVPGFDVTMDTNGQRNFAVRGMLDTYSPKVRVLIDGHSINEPGSGGASWNFDDLVVENIRRIEIVRGPGSALYGQNAFLAVINVITKDTDDIDGFQWTAGGGAFDTQNYNMLFGKEIGNLKISGFFDYYDTEGHSEKIEQDIIFPAPSSMSPGRSQNEKEKTDLNLKLSYKNLELKTKYMKKRRELYIGFDYALNDETMWRDTYIFSDLSYKLCLGEKLKIIPKVYYDQYNTNAFVESRPEGYEITIDTSFGPFSVNYPDGMKALIRSKFRTVGFENQVNYDVSEKNKLTLGFQYEWIHLYDIKYGVNIHPLTFEPLSSFTDFSEDLPFIKRATRQIWSLYLQDEWEITKDIDLTVGVRYDHFKRFGSTTNPRMGLTWHLVKDAYLKLLFATAFRAPNFNEMFLINNNALIGNPNLDPEKINTFEVGLGYNFTKNISGNINYFFNRIRDRIVLLPNADGVYQYENSGGARVKGVEAEIKAAFGNDNYAYANYTFQDAEDTDRNRLPDVPIHKANFGLNFGFSKYVNANLHTFLSGSRPREDGDTRHKLPSYALVNTTLIGKNFIDHLEIRGSINNLFDKGYDDPAPIDTVYSDYSQQGRSFFVELRFEF